MHCLLEMVDTQKECTNSPTGIVIDASFLIQLLKLGTSASIGEFIHGVIIPYLKGLLLIYKRVDIIFDVYLLKSLKYELRVTRGVGEMKRVRLTTKMPRNFRAFLCVDEHKTELNQLVAYEISGLDWPEGTL